MIIQNSESDNRRENESNLKERLFVIKRVSDQLDGIVEDMTDTSNNVKQAAVFMAEGANQQSETMESCIKLTDDFSLMMKNMDYKSIELMKTLNNISSVNKQGNDTVVNLSKSEEKNENALKQLVEQIHSLLSKIQKIDKVVEILYNVCEQTTLLSFNARIEAVHAGQFGKGFTVIASEIRKLSEESRTASDSIIKTIESITEDLDILKTTLNVSTEAFTVERKSVDSVVEAFERINSFVEKFIYEHQQFNRQLSDVSNQEIELITSLRQIFTGIQESAATAQEVASLAMSQNASTAILGKVSKDLATQLNNLDIDFDDENTVNQLTDKKRVSLIYDLDDPFWHPTCREAQKAAKAFDFDLDIFAPKSRETGISEMEKRLEQILHEKPDALIISPIENIRIKEKLKQINAANIKIIFLNSEIDDIKYESLIETNGISAGKTAARVARKYLNNQGEVIVGLWSDEHITSIENRAKGFIEELNSRSNIIVHQISIKSEPSFEEAERIISGVLHQYPTTSLVFATNVGWGLLYARYAKRYRSDFKIITMDFTQEIETAVKEGYINSAIAQRAFSWGTMALDFVEKIFEGKSIKNYVDTGTYEVNLSNIKIYRNRI
jgi:ABC-type sugar transport system, periplasmic component